MTGFAQSAGTLAGARWAWELKTVNAKGLDLRLRVPPGLEVLDIEARRRIGARLTRGTCHGVLAVTREVASRPRIDTNLLAALAQALAEVPVPANVAPASLDGLLAIRGVIEAGEIAPDPAEVEALQAACLVGLDAALDTLVGMREAEGASLLAILEERLAAIERLRDAADAAPQRQPAAIRQKMAATIATLVERHALDPDRLHQEALIQAAKVDIREELDRLATHVVAARELLATGHAVGRRLDFLAQELGREASTLCAKSNDAALTAIGLELRVEIEQFREQVQNVE